MTTDRNILDETADAYAELQRDPERWQEELNERAEWDVTLADGLEDEDMTTTRDGDVLTEANLQAIRHWAIRGKYIRHSDVFLLLDHIASLQQRLDAAEQRAEGRTAGITVQDIRAWLAAEELRLLAVRETAELAHETFIDGCLNIIRTLLGIIHANKLPVSGTTLTESEPTDAGRPEIVCLCGSTRFAETFAAENLRLTLEGSIVLSIGANVSDASLGIAQDSETKAMLDNLHLRKIDLADRILVLNVNGYIGESTRREIAYAERQGKPIDFLWPSAALTEQEPTDA